jgi:hypothetical protein
MSLLDFVGYLIDFVAKSKLKKNIVKITKEEWFKEVFNDISYSDSLWKRVRVRRILRKSDIVEVLRNDSEEREKCIRIVKEEHHRKLQS